MIFVGDELIGCFGTLRYTNGEHRHSDECFEVRVCLDTQGNEVELSDLMTGGILTSDVSEVHAAPPALLARKSCYYTRLVKRVRDQEIKDQAAAGALLDDLVRLVDLYLFADEGTARHWRSYEPVTREARDAFDAAARFILEHRKDRGLGRPRHHILQDTIRALNHGPVGTIEGVGEKLCLLRTS